EERFVHHELEHILPPDIGDEGHLRFHCDDVGEVLLRPDAHIYAARFRQFLQRGNDILKTELIGEEVLESEVAALFGKVRDDFPKGLVAELVRKGLSGTERWSRGNGYSEYNDDRESSQAHHMNEQ